MSDGGTITVVIEANGPLPMPTAGAVENPPRIYFDFAGVKPRRTWHRDGTRLRRSAADARGSLRHQRHPRRARPREDGALPHRRGPERPRRRAAEDRARPGTRGPSAALPPRRQPPPPAKPVERAPAESARHGEASPTPAPATPVPPPPAPAPAPAPPPVAVAPPTSTRHSARRLRHRRPPHSAAVAPALRHLQPATSPHCDLRSAAGASPHRLQRQRPQHQRPLRLPISVARQRPASTPSSSMPTPPCT